MLSIGLYFTTPRIFYPALNILLSILYSIYCTGDSPSGKAPGSGPGIRGFESLIPSQMRQHEMRPVSLIVLLHRKLK